MIRAVRSEWIKIRTTNTWWLMGLGILLFTGLALLVNATSAHFQLQQPAPPPDNAAANDQQFHDAQQQQYTEAHTAAGLAKIAANLYTSGQYFGGLFVLLLGALLMTNEYFHQTATATFLTLPHRTVVILAKFATGALLGAGAWVLTTAVNIPITALFLRSEHVSNGLGTWDVTQSMLLNLAAFAIWAVLGVGLGVLIRSQIGAVVTGTVVYLLGTFAVSIIVSLIRTYVIKEDWVETAQVLMPAIASMVMVTPGGEAFNHAPPQWVGAAVLIGYGVLFGLIGTLLTRHRDVS